jgi:hypothetical protein
MERQGMGRGGEFGERADFRRKEKAGRFELKREIGAKWDATGFLPNELVS